MSPRAYIVTVAAEGRPSVAVGPFANRSQAMAYADTMRVSPGIDAGRCAVVPVRDQLAVARAVLNPPARGTIGIVRDTDGIAGQPTRRVPTE